MFYLVFETLYWILGYNTKLLFGIFFFILVSIKKSNLTGLQFHSIPVSSSTRFHSISY